MNVAHFEAALWYRLLCAIRVPQSGGTWGATGEGDVGGNSAVTFP
jgi:hypothetical protein